MNDIKPTAWAVYGRKSGALRYVVGDDETARDLTEHYDVVPLYPAPTPPADDVREALAAIVKRTSQAFGGPSLAEFANDPPTRKHYATADAIRAAFEVRPHGTVTDADDVREAVRRGYNASPGLAVDLVVESIVQHLAEVRR